MPPDPEAFADVVVETIAMALAPLRAEIAVLKAQVAQPPRDGRDGLPGLPGPAGEKGAPGVDGTNGRDGTLENIKAIQSEDFRTVTLCFKDGTPIEGGVLTFPFPQFKGLYEAEKAYEVGHVVAQHDGLWIAEAAIEPGITPGAGPTPWRLAVRKGQKGRDGKNGPPGKDGRERTPERPGLPPMTERSW